MSSRQRLLLAGRQTGASESRGRRQYARVPARSRLAAMRPMSGQRLIAAPSQ
jgi:hypothetical protein